MSSLISAIGKALQANRQERPWDGYWHVSQLYKCSRLLYVDSLDDSSLINHKYTDQQLLNFRVGHANHHAVQEAIRLSDAFVAEELPLKNEEHKIMGSCDNVVNLLGYNECVEFKGMKERYFIDEKYLPQHILQLTFYMWMSGYNKTGIILYMNKNSSELKEIRINYNHSLVEETLAKLKYIEQQESLPMKYLSCTKRVDHFCYMAPKCRIVGLEEKPETYLEI